MRDWSEGYEPPRTDPGDATPLDRDEARALRDILSSCPGGYVSFQVHEALEPNPSPRTMP